MRILLVEPQYRKARAKQPGSPPPKPGAPRDDNTLWYPPLGLMKLSRFHKMRHHDVKFVSGCDPSLFEETGLFGPGKRWDRVYITTLFTYHFDKIVETINFYKEALGGTTSRVFVGGIMASLMPKAIFEATGVQPKCGVLTSPEQIGLSGSDNIDRLPPDYSPDLLDPTKYAINDTYHGYATRGCKNKCPWCGVPMLEPEYVPYIDIKPMIYALREEHGDKATLKLMDNNVLNSDQLEQIVDDLLELGYGRGKLTEKTKKQRVVDFNQGLDATHITDRTMRLLAKLHIKPMRIAFDRLAEKKDYVRALRLAKEHGVTEFSNYMLYNFKDTPHDLYERLIVNIELNEEWVRAIPGRMAGKIYSYPMRYAPIQEEKGDRANRKRDAVRNVKTESHDWLKEPVWTRRFIRNIEIMKGAAHGAISPTPTLARRTLGETFEEFVANLYMPEELLRNRNQHEKKVYPHEPRRKPGSGKVEEFRAFVQGLLAKQDGRFRTFHEAATSNSSHTIKEALKTIEDKEIHKWLKLYLRRR